jgi:hypothetical protein
MDWQSARCAASSALISGHVHDRIAGQKILPADSLGLFKKLAEIMGRKFGNFPEQAVGAAQPQIAAGDIMPVAVKLEPAVAHPRFAVNQAFEFVAHH